MAPPAPDTSPPSAPGALSATAVSGSRVDLSWGTASDNVGVSGYRVERCQGSGCSNFAQIATTAGTTTSYSDTTASAGTSYSYRVRANDAASNLGPYTNTATATTPSPDTSPPSAPGAFRPPRSAVVVSISAGVRRATTSVSAATASSAARAAAQQLRPDRYHRRHDHQLQRHHSQRRHQLQLPRPRQRRRQQPRPLHQHRHRNNGEHHLLDWRHRYRALRDGGVAEQRRRRSQCDQRRPVHVQHAPGRWRDLQRDRQDRSLGRPARFRAAPAPSPLPTSPTLPSPLPVIQRPAAPG